MILLLLWLPWFSLSSKYNTKSWVVVSLVLYWSSIVGTVKVSMPCFWFGWYGRSLALSFLGPVVLAFIQDQGYIVLVVIWPRIY